MKLGSSQAQVQDPEQLFMTSRHRRNVFWVAGSSDVLQRITTYRNVLQRNTSLQRIADLRRATHERITADHFQGTLAGQSCEMSTQQIFQMKFYPKKSK